MNPIFIFSENYHEFIQWGFEHDINVRSDIRFRYLSAAEILRGYIEPSIIRCGNYRNRLDCQEVESMIRLRGGV